MMNRYEITVQLEEKVTREARMTVEATDSDEARQIVHNMFVFGDIPERDWYETERDLGIFHITDIQSKPAQ
jgi:hypothetical protein